LCYNHNTDTDLGSDFMFDVGRRVKELRELRGLSMTKLSKIARVGQSTLSYIESGRQSPTVDVLERICSALGITLAEFFSPVIKDDLRDPLIQQLEVYASKLSKKELEYLCGFLEEISKEKVEMNKQSKV